MATEDRFTVPFKIKVDVKKDDGGALSPFFDGHVKGTFHNMRYEDVLFFEKVIGSVFTQLNEAGWSKAQADGGGTATAKK